MKRYIIQIAMLLVLLSSCSNNRTLYLKFNHIDGLSGEAPVTLNGFQIGHVSDIHLNEEGKIIVKLNLDKKPSIPIDSQFEIVSRDLLGSKEILLHPGNEKEMILNGDTLYSTMEQKKLASDSLKMKVNEMLENLTGAKQRDSILYELRRLNRNLEELKKEK